jgi:hypothetical protein
MGRQAPWNPRGPWSCSGKSILERLIASVSTPGDALPQLLQTVAAVKYQLDDVEGKSSHKSRANFATHLWNEAENSFNRAT